jgi:alpha-glucosidase
MKKLYLALCIVSWTCADLRAIDLSRLKGIAPVSSLAKFPAAIVFSCADRSQVRVSILAPDLMRVRASFRRPLPVADHSWAIAKTAWDHAGWDLREEPTQTVMTTSQLELVVHHSPLILEFRDPASHQTVNMDERPMMYDPQGTAVAAAKRLGFNEHFYGLGEKAAHLDKRRGQFTMWNSDMPGYKEGTDPIYQSIPFYLRHFPGQQLSNSL